MNANIQIEARNKDQIARLSVRDNPREDRGFLQPLEANLTISAEFACLLNAILKPRNL